MPRAHTPSRCSIKLSSLFQTSIYFVLNITAVRVQIKPEVFRRLEAWSQQLFGRGRCPEEENTETSGSTGEPWARRPHAPEAPGDAPEQPAGLTLHAPGRHSIPSAASLAGTSIYVMSPDPGREGGWEEGRRRETALQAARPSAHAATIQRMSRKPVRCHCTDPSAAHARTHTCTPPKEQLQKAELSLERRKSIIKVLIHKKWLPSETAVSSWKKEGDGEVF